MNTYWIIGITSLVVVVIGVALAYLLRDRNHVPTPKRCPRCGKRQGVHGRPIHFTPGDPPILWGVICHPCWTETTINERYEYYARQAQAWGLFGTPEWQSIRAALEVGL